MRIKVKSLPQTTKYKGGGPSGPRTGDQMNYGLFSNQSGTINTNNYQQIPGSEDVRGTYPEVDRKDANIEVELGEIVVSPDLSTIYKAAGKKHHKGGTPIQAKEGSYIVSDFIKTNPQIKEMLGFEPGNDKKETWAKFLSKNVNTKYFNSLAALISDKEKGKVVDPYSYNTAKNKLPEYQELVSKVALGNEMTKAMMGKEYSIPQIAMSALESLQIPVPDENSDPMYKMQMGGVNHNRSYRPQAKPAYNLSSESSYAGHSVDRMLYENRFDRMMKFHPSSFERFKDLKKYGVTHPEGSGTGFVDREGLYNDRVNEFNAYQDAVNNLTQRSLNSSEYDNYATFKPKKKMQGGGTTPPWLSPWVKSNTDKGSLSPKNKRTTYSGENNSMYDDYNYWKGQNMGKDFKDLAEYQSYVYNRVLEANPESVAGMWNDFGQTGANGDKPVISDDMLFNWDKTPNVEAMGSTDLMNNFADGKYPGARTAALTGFRYKPNPTLQDVTVSATRKKAPAASANPTPKAAANKDPLEFDGQPTEYNQRPNAFDQMALLDAMGNPINTYYPWAAKPEVAYMDPQFDEPNYYPIQSAQRQRMDMMNQISNPNIARAVGSYQPDQISGIINETQRAHSNNLQVANNAKGFNAQAFNNHSNMMAGINTDLYNKTIMSQEQRDIAKRMKSQDVRGAAQNMVGNMQKMQYMQSMFPQYSMSGPFWNKLQFNGGKGFEGLYGAPTGQTMNREQFLAANPGYSKLVGTADEYKIDDAVRDDAFRGSTNYFRNSKNFNQNAINPMFLQMMESMGYPPTRTR